MSYEDVQISNANPEILKLVAEDAGGIDLECVFDCGEGEDHRRVSNLKVIAAYAYIKDSTFDSHFNEYVDSIIELGTFIRDLFQNEEPWRSILEKELEEMGYHFTRE